MMHCGLSLFKEGNKTQSRKAEALLFYNEGKIPNVLADRMATSQESQPQGEILSVCRGQVFKFDIQAKGWSGIAKISKLSLIRNASVYLIFGAFEDTGQVTINVTLGKSTEYVLIDTDPERYKLTISPQEIYIFTLTSSNESKTFSILVQNVLRTLKESGPRIEEPPTSPREPWVGRAAPPSPSEPMTEQLLTRSNLGNRMPEAQLPGRAGHLVEHYTSLIPSSRPGLSSSTLYLNQQVTAQTPQTISTLNRPSSPHVRIVGQRSMNSGPIWRSDFEAQVESLCNELAFVISNGNVQAAKDIAEVMATEQLPLSIKMKNPKVITVEQGDKTIDLKVVVEDRETSGGVFVMKVLPVTTIKQLQEEVAERFGFPPKVQKWIIGKKMAHPPASLAEFHVKKAGFTAYLYLVSSKSVGLTRQEFEHYTKRNEDGTISALGPQSNDTPVNRGLMSPPPNVSAPLSRAQSMPALQAAAPSRTEGFASHYFAAGPTTRPTNQGQPIPAHDMRVIQEAENFNSTDNRIHTAGNISGILEAFQREEAMPGALNEGHSIPVQNTEVEPQGWKCNQCTFVNIPTRPGCEMCGSDRPQDYVVPENTMVREQERNRLEEERRLQALFEQALEQQEQEQAIAREMNFQQLVQTAQQNLIQNAEEFDCEICYTTVLPGEGVVLRECLHSFCRDCLREHIRNCTDPEVQCPFQDAEFACHSLITAQEIKSLLSVQDYEKFLNRSLSTAESQASNSFHCKTPNCPGWCIYEDNSNIFHCPVCDKQNCLTCKALHFPEMNCKEYQEDLKRRAENDVAAKQTQQFLEKMITKGEAMKCPQCEIILLKKDGCDWMRCSMCRLEICWATRGPRWGPEGVGDITGGCKCRIGGKKCHPKCRNCH